MSEYDDTMKRIGELASLAGRCGGLSAELTQARPEGQLHSDVIVTRALLAQAEALLNAASIRVAQAPRMYGPEPVRERD